MRNQTVPPDQKKHFQNFKDLLDKMFTLDPEKRITPRDALKHPFIAEQL